MNKSYTLPIPLEKISGLGFNPLRREWKHRDLGGIALYMEYAWDFIVPNGTPVYAARDGEVIDVRMNSDLEATEEQLKAITKDPANPKPYQLAVVVSGNYCTPIF